MIGSWKMSYKDERTSAIGSEDDPIKITLLGGGGVGKSCVTLQFLSKTFENDVKKLQKKIKKKNFSSVIQQSKIHIQQQ